MDDPSDFAAFVFRDCFRPAIFLPVSDHESFHSAVELVHLSFSRPLQTAGNSQMKRGFKGQNANESSILRSNNLSGFYLFQEKVVLSNDLVNKGEVT